MSKTIIEAIDPTLAAARSYIAIGFLLTPVYAMRWVSGLLICSCWAGLKCKSPGKHPVLKNWQLTASRDPRQIEHWFGRGDRNIGLVTGKRSGVVGVDIDANAGGFSAWLDLNERFGLPETARTMSGRGTGNFHDLYDYPENVERISNGKLGEGIDIKGDDGLLLLPPSNHASGGTYQHDANFHLDTTLLKVLPAWAITYRWTPAKGEIRARAGAAKAQPASAENNKGALTQAARDLASAIHSKRGGPIEELKAEIRIGNKGGCKVVEGANGPVFHDFETEDLGGVVKACRAYQIDRKELPASLRPFLGRVKSKKQSDSTADVALIDAWILAHPAEVAGEGHPALAQYLSEGIPWSVLEASAVRVARLERDGVRYPVALWPMTDLAGETVGVIAEFVTQDGAFLEQVCEGGGRGGVIVAPADDPDDAGAYVVGGLMSALAAAAAMPGRRIIAARSPKSVNRVILGEAIKASIICSTAAREAYYAVRNHQHRLDRAGFVKASLFETLRDGGLDAVRQALAGARTVVLREQIRGAALEPSHRETVWEEAFLAACATLEAKMRSVFDKYKEAIAAGRAGNLSKIRTMIAAAAGLGKTELALRLLIEFGIQCVFAVADYDKADKLFDRAQALKAGSAVRFYAKLRPYSQALLHCLDSEFVSYFREADLRIGERPGSCIVTITVDDGETGGRGNKVTVKCPHFDFCQYNKIQPSLINIVTHESLFSAGHPNLPEDALLIIDETLKHTQHEDIPFDELNSVRRDWFGMLVGQDARRDRDDGGLLSRRWFDAEVERARRCGELAEWEASQVKPPEMPRTATEAYLARMRAQAWGFSVDERGRPLPNAPQELKMAWVDQQAKIGRRPRLARLLRWIADWYEANKKQKCGVYYNEQRGGLEWDHSRPLHERWRKSAIVALDASDRRALRHPELIDADTIRISVPRNVIVVQLSDRQCYRSFFDGEDGVRHCREISEFATRGAADFLVAQKDVLTQLEVATPHTRAHFNALRGDDTHKGAQVAVIVGRVQPKGDAVDRIVRAIDPDQAMPGQDCLPQVTLRLQARSGASAPVTVRVGATDLHDDVLRSIREDELLQAIDRMRLVRRSEPPIVYLLCNLPLPGIIPDALIEWRADVAESDPIAAYSRYCARNGGLISFSSRRMAAARRANGEPFFDTDEAAKQARKNSPVFAEFAELFAGSAAAPIRCQNPNRFYTFFDTQSTQCAEAQLAVLYRERGARGSASRAILPIKLMRSETIDAVVASWPVARIADKLREALGVDVTDVALVGVGYAPALAPVEKPVPVVAAEHEGVRPKTARGLEADDFGLGCNGGGAQKLDVEAAEETPLSSEPVWATLQRAFLGGDAEAVRPPSGNEIDFVSSRLVGQLAQFDRDYGEGSWVDDAAHEADIRAAAAIEALWTCYANDDRESLEVVVDGPTLVWVIEEEGNPVRPSHDVEIFAA